MSTNPSEEPVAYLGGKAGGPPAPPAGGEIEGYLGGDAPPDSLPALPPAGVSAVYSASDFIPPPQLDEPPTEEAPPAYDTYAAEPPVAATEPTDYEQYAAPEPPTQTQEPATQTVEEPPPSQEQSGEFEEPGLPKTISQQDAENIIKRITTKKILPPEVAAQEGPRVVPPPELTPRGSPKLGRLIVLLVLVFGAVGGVMAFPEVVGPYLPEGLWGLIGYTPPPPPQVDNLPPPKTKEQILEEKLRGKVLESEWRAFGYASQKDFEEARKGLGSGGAPKDAPGQGEKNK